jgi:hypothetical protein
MVSTLASVLWDLRIPLPLLNGLVRSLHLTIDEEGVLADGGVNSTTPRVPVFQKHFWVEFRMCWPAELEVDPFTGLQVLLNTQVNVP